MKKILVPTDFSDCAANALDFAIQSAKYIPAEITLLHAFEVSGSVYTDYMGVNMEFTQSLLDDAREKLLRLKKDTEEKEGIKLDTIFVKGSVFNSVITIADEIHADLIVMGTSGASGLKEKIVGTKTASIIGSSNIPVIAIPKDYKWKKPSKFLLATNRFEKQPAILDFIFELADLYMAGVQAAVFTDEDDDNAVTFLEHARKISPYENQLKVLYKEDDLKVAHLYGVRFEETLQQHIRENGIDMLVMITYKKEEGLWKRIFNPSVTKRMSYHTTIPLLAIPFE